MKPGGERIFLVAPLPGSANDPITQRVRIAPNPRHDPISPRHVPPPHQPLSFFFSRIPCTIRKGCPWFLQICSSAHGYGPFGKSVNIKAIPKYTGKFQCTLAVSNIKHNCTILFLSNVLIICVCFTTYFLKDRIYWTSCSVFVHSRNGGKINTWASGTMNAIALISGFTSRAWKSKKTIVTVRKRSCGKVMFSHLYVSHSVHRGRAWQRGRGWDVHGRRDGHCSGRYASYWNAFLLIYCFDRCFWRLESYITFPKI